MFYLAGGQTLRPFTSDFSRLPYDLIVIVLERVLLRLLGRPILMMAIQSSTLEIYILLGTRDFQIQSVTH